MFSSVLERLEKIWKLNFWNFSLKQSLSYLLPNMTVCADSQVPCVKISIFAKKNWRFVNLYIFGKLWACRIRISMFPFAYIYFLSAILYFQNGGHLSNIFMITLFFVAEMYFKLLINVFWLFVIIFIIFLVK